MKAFDAISNELRSLPASGDTIRDVPIDSKYFVSLSPDDGKIIFVDSGSGEVVRGANVCVMFVRVCAICYDNNRRVKRDVEESFIVVSRGVASVIDMQGHKRKLIEVPLSFGTPSEIAGYARKLLEFEQLQKYDGFVVRDGDLEVREEVGQKLISTLKGPVVGLSKTTTLTTNTGASAPLVLRRMGPQGVWLYDANESLKFVKLHPNSNYVFRCDVIGRPNWGALVKNSTDPVFLGYPYGLLDVDKHAQVTRQELAQLRARFMLQTREEFRDIETALDAHDILDAL